MLSVLSLWQRVMTDRRPTSDTVTGPPVAPVNGPGPPTETSRDLDTQTDTNTLTGPPPAPVSGPVPPMETSTHLHIHISDHSSERTMARLQLTNTAWLGLGLWLRLRLIGWGWWPRWVQVGECFFWYRLIWVIPDKIHRESRKTVLCVGVLQLGLGPRFMVRVNDHVSELQSSQNDTTYIVCVSDRRTSRIYYTSTCMSWSRATMRSCVGNILIDRVKVWRPTLREMGNWRYVALVVVLWCPALSSSSSVAALRWEPVNVHV